mmetsp:Transcript_14080/g.28898  ORF Transcript_14080/g.28898 Transcript_14080/m.28898 type:complete len:213 (-) Transcript_14080:935-1573(-)
MTRMASSNRVILDDLDRVPDPAALTIAVRTNFEHVPGVNLKDQLRAANCADDNAAARANSPLLYAPSFSLFAPLRKRYFAPHARSIGVALYDLLRKPVELLGTIQELCYWHTSGNVGEIHAPFLVVFTLLLNLVALLVANHLHCDTLVDSSPFPSLPKGTDAKVKEACDKLPRVAIDRSDNTFRGERAPGVKLFVDIKVPGVYVLKSAGGAL